ncbi:CotH kinase family protein [Candidatus Sumerlaeota bacterium]|nr:CotH kinase family protein [Candidatus Sumerlaeota bacterium]
MVKKNILKINTGKNAIFPVNQGGLGFFFLPILLGITLSICSAYDPMGDPNYQASQIIFDDSTIPQIKISVDPAYLEEIMYPGNEMSDICYPAVLRFTNHLVDDAISSVGLRLRGKVSRYGEKKSFKISFNEYAQGRHFRGVKKFNLNAESSDPTLVRTKLCWELFREFRVPAPRANLVKLFMNDEYYGFYLNVEHVDTTFVKTRFGNKNGNLFKCTFVSEPADLTFMENGRYDLCGSGTTYELMNNDFHRNYSDLARFIDILNNTPDHIFAPEIEKAFNVEGFLKWMVVSIHCGSWDDYLWNGSNYYLYHNTDTGKFEFIPYDYNQAFGIDTVGRDWAMANVYEFQRPNQPRPLSERILAQKKYKNLYSFLLSSFANHVYCPEKLKFRINGWKDKIAAAAEDAPPFAGFEWDMDSFNRSFEEADGGIISHGLKPFIRIRRKATLDQIQPYTTPTLEMSPVRISPPSALPEEETPLPTLVINEICAGNSSIIQDSAGDFDDWIEIYNYGTEPVSLGGMYLTDDRANPGRHRIADGIMVPAKGYVIFWADADVTQGPFHLNFKLSRNGEMVGLFEKTPQGARRIDLVIYGPQQPNTSYGRVEDGAYNWRVFTRPTPGGTQ